MGHHFLCLLVFLFNFLPTISSLGTHLCSHHEATALLQFKNSFSVKQIYSEFCYGSHPKTNSWNESTDCCSWIGVTCDHVHGHVTGLDLSCSSLYGTFPSNATLFLLPHLQKLNLAFNYFEDSEMPSEFGRFASLVDLNLSQTSFKGRFPAQVSHLSKLASLDLTGNYELILEQNTVEGLVHNLTEVRLLVLDLISLSSINPHVFMNLSSSLRSLSLGGCDLRGEFPESTFYLPNLKFLNLGNNIILSLSFPQFNRSSHLEHLDLSQMSFSKELIDSIHNLGSLKYLCLAETYFLEGLPVSITNLSSLEQLVMPSTYFSGGLPHSIGTLVSLKYLILPYSTLSGLIPRSLGNLLQLIHLDLSSNNFSGAIPSSITNLTLLEFLSIGYNQVGGSLPDKVTAFPNLVYLDLSHNLLNGTLPSWMYTVSSLKEIFLFHNQLSGQIKEFQTKSLEKIHLEDNKLQGPLPPSMFQLANLTSLQLSSNNLSGVVEFGMSPNLRNLDLSFNSLLSFNPSSPARLPNLQYLDLCSCNINEFPHFLRGSKALESLDLSYNKIEGKIPKWMEEVGKESLSYLNVSHNFLTQVGKLPWKNIKFLDLSSNFIHGNLPIPPPTIDVFLFSNNSLSGEAFSSICNSTSLGVLDLSYNNLSGVIPMCLGNLSESLSFLNLRKNRFHGMIPPTFTDNCQLSNLNLNGNQLEGPLTPSIANCKGLEVLDLGNNNITDTFPPWLGTLPELQVLILKSNQMHGPMHNIGSGIFFSKIQIFDLSDNHFTGPLPVRYITNFKAMINLTKNATTMPYMGVQNNGGFYTYSVGIIIKGREMELVKIFTMLTTIDLSNNHFRGEIPKAIGRLNSLKGLNLSHNHLRGSIPASMRNLASLEWLDLSSNKLVGKIPEQLLDLTSLSFLNLSENELVGCIPRGKQFNTFENTSYEGNRGLRGFPLSRDCYNNDPPPPSNVATEDGSKSELGFGWKVVVLGYGCGVILGLAMGYVVFQTGKPKWVVNLVEDYLHKRRSTRPKIAYRNNGRRRIK